MFCQEVSSEKEPVDVFGFVEFYHHGDTIGVTVDVFLKGKILIFFLFHYLLDLFFFVLMDEDGPDS